MLAKFERIASFFVRWYNVIVPGIKKVEKALKKKNYKEIIEIFIKKKKLKNKNKLKPVSISKNKISFILWLNK